MSVTVTTTEQTVEVSQNNQTVTLTPVTQTVEVAAAGPQGAAGATGATGATGASGASGASGVIAVNAPLTNAGTSSNANLSVSAASTSASGVVRLSDSVSTTSSVLAATPTAVKSAYDIATAALTSSGFAQYNQGQGTSAVITNAPWYVFSAISSFTLGAIMFNRIVPYRNITVSNIAFASGNVASSGLTLCRFGIYTRSGTTMTLVARTASDTTIGNTTNTKYTRALNTTGGYPATYDMTAGNEYYLAVVSTGTTNWNACCSTTIQSANNAIGGVFQYFKSSQTDLGATVATVSVNQIYFFAEVS